MLGSHCQLTEELGRPLEAPGLEVLSYHIFMNYINLRFYKNFIYFMSSTKTEI